MAGLLVLKKRVAVARRPLREDFQSLYCHSDGRIQLFHVIVTVVIAIIGAHDIELNL